MNRWLLLIGFALCSCATTPPLAPRPPRVTMVTTAGPITLRLLPEVAPQTVRRFLRLARAGVYDSLYFYRVEQNFVVQTAAAEDREVPLTAEQQELIAPIALEKNELRHQRGVLSLAHGDDPDSGETSFSILLADAPHLDGHYTAFGVILDSADVLQIIEKTYDQQARDTGGQRLQIIRMDVEPAPTP